VSNVSAGAAPFGVSVSADASLDVEMAAYDSLPPDIRHVLQDAPLKPNCAVMAAKIRGALRFGTRPEKLVRIIETEMRAAVPKLARATYGAGHPQA
jgi:hypothetical protein